LWFFEEFHHTTERRLTVPHPNDDALVEAILKGDESAAVTLINRYNPYVFGTMRSRGVNSGDASDLTQEVWLKVHKSLPGYQPQEKFKAWLDRIIRSVHIDWGRKQQRTLQPVADDEQDVMPDIIDLGTENPLDTLIRAEGRQLVREALDAMPDSPNKAAFIMRDIERVALAEIARAFNITEGAAAMRALRGRNAFQMTLRRIAPEYFTLRREKDA
jgi:RNA polymerase sigma-70 factor, ECF subfamily